jgi:hypothetical protein
LPDFTASLAGFVTAAFFTAILAAGFAAVLAGAFVNGLRAESGGGALARADGFDFATVFLDFATALAMDSNYPKMGE